MSAISRTFCPLQASVPSVPLPGAPFGELLLVCGWLFQEMLGAPPPSGWGPLYAPAAPSALPTPPSLPWTAKSRGLSSLCYTVPVSVPQHHAQWLPPSEHATVY